MTLQRRLEQRHRGRVLAAILRESGERYARAQRGRSISRRIGLGDQIAQRGLRICGGAEANCELQIGELQLACCFGIEIGSGLEVVGGDSELGRELAERLDRGLARPRLDARDVGVRDARSSEFALRKTPLEPQAL